MWRRNSCSDTGGNTTPAAPRLNTLIIFAALCLVPIFINAYHLKTTRTRKCWWMMNYHYDDSGKDNLLKKCSTPWRRWESSCPGLKKAQNLSFTSVELSQKDHFFICGIVHYDKVLRLNLTTFHLHSFSTRSLLCGAISCSTSSTRNSFWQTSRRKSALFYMKIYY